MNNFKKAMVAVLTVATLAGATVAPAHAGKWWKKPLATGVGVGIGLGIVGAVTRPRHGTVYVERECWDERVTFINEYGDRRVRYERVCN